MTEGSVYRVTDTGRVLSLVTEDPSLPVYEGSCALTEAQLRVLESDTLITIAIAGIRGGKTHVGALKMILYALANPCEADEVHLVGSPTYAMSRVPVEKIFRLLYDKSIFPICPLIRYIKSERTFLLACADGRITKIQIWSLHEPNRLRGVKAKSAWCDEGAYITKEAWDIVQGRVADSNGPIWITTTPAGYNFVYDLYDKARNGDPTITVVHWTSDENQFANEEGIAGLIGRFDPKTYQQEVQGKFIRNAGIVYYTFTRKVHLVRGAFNPAQELWVGQDFNVNPMCSVFAQPFKNTRGEEGAHIKWGRRAENSDTYGLVAYLDEFCRVNHYGKSKITIYPDAAGKQRSTAGKSDFRILREAGYKVDAPAANPLIKDRVNCVNGLLAPPTRVPRIIVDPDMEKFIQGLEKQAWEEGADPPTPDKSQGYDHWNDALGYMCWRRWPLKTQTRLAA